METGSIGLFAIQTQPGVWLKTNEYIFFTLFAIAAYLIVTDKSVAAAFYYVTKIIEGRFHRTKWWLLHNPQNPVVKYLIWRRSMKLAKELQKHFDKNK